ncbi:MAG: pyruvate dehydrogenase (acetyl-transferring) E1 component subunit alpha [Chloroflexi bacterium]|nr:pyruvate dehydrogenase (acetyl-transferring) E1 component subunit alpha [Chloroflexota bacterium]
MGGLRMDKARLLEFLRQMLLIRRFEEKSAEMYARGKIGGFLHLYIGQEATGVGVIAALRPEDHIVTTYREHGHALARGLEPGAIMAELFGKATGVSHGKGGSMHLFDASKNFWGGYAIVAGGMPIAVGLALAAQYRGEARIVLNIFGDGAVNEGEFHEALNLASVWKLPVLFLCENNLYAMGTAIARVSAVPEVYRRAAAYDIPAQRVDGQDVEAVYEAAQAAVEQVRSGRGPYLLEAVTYRFRGHSMADAVLYRTREEEEQWKARDPIELLRRRLEKDGQLTGPELAALQAEAEQVVAAAVAFAEASPPPPPEALYEDVYA